MERKKIITSIIAFLDNIDEENTSEALVLTLGRSRSGAREEEIRSYIDFMKRENLLVDIAQDYEQESLWITMKGYQFQACRQKQSKKNNSKRSDMICALLNHIDDTGNKMEAEGLYRLFSSAGAEASMENVRSYLTYLKKEKLVEENPKGSAYPQNAWVSAKGYTFLQLMNQQ